MISFPNAKINIGLRIVSKRSDGYHDIETVFYPVGLSDALEFVMAEEKAGKDILTVSGLDTGASPENNIVLKALLKMHAQYEFPYVRVHLHKAIPSGAGMGGGSSDAACMIRAINRFFDLKITGDEIRELALGIGSDCPFFIENKPAYAKGRGELLSPLPHFAEGHYLVILNPGVGISTKEAYENCRPSKPESNLIELVQKPIQEWKDCIFNDFEEFAFRKHQVIGEIKAELYNVGAVFALMSGSGSSVFGLFNEKPAIPQSLMKYLIYQGKI
jgi:4-diphosphocytidyl-2-C-methyl-D-erythritol kinase